QYTHARICSVLEKGKSILQKNSSKKKSLLNEEEKELVKLIHRFPEIVNDAAAQFSPAAIANYVYELAKSYNHFYHKHTIVDKERSDQSLFRLQLSKVTASIIHKSLALLGIESPEKM
ncbi:MAG TPA: DALR anticodon-binding domain-containing protein, partial [Bacteroidia bacterium]|nr:DALR anticodon-binding domain-containing protein [Bacteroidia bacterium]